MADQTLGRREHFAALMMQEMVRHQLKHGTYAFTQDLGGGAYFKWARISIDLANALLIELDDFDRKIQRDNNQGGTNE